MHAVAVAVPDGMRRGRPVTPLVTVPGARSARWTGAAQRDDAQRDESLREMGVFRAARMVLALSHRMPQAPYEIDPNLKWVLKAH